MHSGDRRWIRVAGILAIVALIGVIAAGCEQKQVQQAADQETTQAQETDQAAVPAEIIKVNAATFDEVVLKSELPVLVDFYADWCGPCRALHPTLEELAADYAGRAKVVQVNVDENGELASRYNVRGIPALFIIKDGQVVDQTTGLQPRANFERLLNKHVD